MGSFTVLPFISRLAFGNELQACTCLVSNQGWRVLSGWFDKKSESEEAQFLNVSASRRRFFKKRNCCCDSTLFSCRMSCFLDSLIIMPCLHYILLTLDFERDSRCFFHQHLSFISSAKSFMKNNHEIDNDDEETVQM